MPGSITAFCSFCGNQQLVHPSIPVAHHVGRIGDSVGNVDRSTARLAAEMSLPRLHAERQQWLASYHHLYGMRIGVITQWNLTIGIGTFLVGVILMAFLALVHVVLGVVAFFACIGGGVYLIYRVKQHFKRVGTKYDAPLAATHAQLQSIDARIAESYRIANS